MHKHDKDDASMKANTKSEPPEDDVKAAIEAGGGVVGRSVDEDLLVEGPNSK
jgi:hypothetical protein